MIKFLFQRELPNGVRVRARKLGWRPKMVGEDFAEYKGLNINDNFPYQARGRGGVGWM